MTRYIVKDSLGNTMRAFLTYSQAYTYRVANGSSAWTIETKDFR